MKKKKRIRLRTLLAVSGLTAVLWAWSCSNAPQYPGGGRDLGPQEVNMGTSEAGMDGTKPDTGTDTGVDTGVTDTGVSQ
jgi:hypothetical protein